MRRTSNPKSPRRRTKPYGKAPKRATPTAGVRRALVRTTVRIRRAFRAGEKELSRQVARILRGDLPAKPRAMKSRPQNKIYDL